MTDKEIYKKLWEAYTDGDKLDFLKDYISNSLTNIDRTEYTMYHELYLRREHLEIILKGLNKL